MSIKSRGIRWKTTIKALLVPFSACYLVPSCQQRSLGLDLLTPPFFNRASDVAHVIAADNTRTPPLLPPVLQPLSKRHLANKTPVHTEAGTKRGILRSHCDCHTLQRTLPPSPKPGCLVPENFSPPDQRGYHRKHGRDPNPDTHPVCVCVRECVIRACGL